MARIHIYQAGTASLPKFPQASLWANRLCDGQPMVADIMVVSTAPPPTNACRECRAKS